MKKLLFTLAFAAICGTSAAQDLIVKQNAEEIQAKVLRIGASKIEYTQSGNPGGPVYTLPTGEVLYVKYGDGRKEVFNKTPTTPKRIMAQYKDSYPHYQGEVAVGYALGIGNASKQHNTDRVAVETVHGVRLSPYAFIGAGAGFNYFYGKEKLTAEDAGLREPDNGAGIVSAFANAKGYYPVSKSTSLYLSLDLGASIGVWNYLKDTRDIYVAAGPGVSFGSTRNRLRCDASIRLQHMGPGTNAILFRIGFGF